MVVDALSRMKHLMVIQVVSKVQPLWLQEVANSYGIDEKAQELLAQLVIHSPDNKYYSPHQGIIKFKDNIWVGSNTVLQTKIITTLHSSIVGGHSG